MTEPQIASNGYKTSDTSLATYLYCMGFIIIDIDYTQPRVSILFKEDSKEIREHERLYYTDQAKITPTTYSRIHKRLSTLIRNQTTWTEGVLNA